MNSIKKHILLIVALTAGIAACSQKKEYTIVQNGVIFFSGSYERLLDTLETRDDINFIHIPDIFLPVKAWNQSPLVMFTKTNLKEGIDLQGVLKDRELLKSKAIKYINTDSLSSCYIEHTYYLLPVRMKYKLLRSVNSVKTCDRPIEITTNGKKIAFGYSAKEIKMITVELLPHPAIASLSK